MAVISRTCAALRFFGDDLDPAVLTARLGKPPTDSARKGETVETKSGRKFVKRTGSWIYEANDFAPGDVNEQIDEIFSGLTADSDVWAALVKKYKVDLFLGLFLENSTEGIEISAKSVALLACRGIPIGLSIYASATENDKDEFV